MIGFLTALCTLAGVALLIWGVRQAVRDFAYYFDAWQNADDFRDADYGLHGENSL